jgi:glycosyltransferase involved in cell wall biosynthesis
VHNGIDLDAYPIGTNKEDFLLFVGRSCREKGPDRAVEVARRVGLPLVMVVKRQEEFEQEYWKEAVEPRLTGAEVIYEGISHEEKVALMRMARAVLFPIDWPEPFGLVMIESMACSTPVLATPLGAATEVVADRRTGFLCPSLDDMVEAVGWVEEISPHGCRAHVGLRFSAQAMVRGYERIFHNVLRQRDDRTSLAVRA